ncbi:hypothetical protein [Amaricoccus sp.]|uniref:hypothetical protein n=1 Tax=Amaricoccus sp. TaxID=1872485 RepID=UPI001B58C82A|nr:hypothetical protein [Amaricoccus sp.]MBP7241742.1 hypothetical protein [Amaricoccus sp.]
MKSCIFAAAAVLTIGATAGFADTGQIAASAGLQGDEAAGLTLTEIARHKFNADTRPDDRIVVVMSGGGASAAARSQLAAAGGIDAATAAGMSLSELAAAKFRAEARGDDRQPLVVASPGAVAAGAQFAASAGVRPEVARGKSMNEIFLEGIVRRSDDE